MPTLQDESKTHQPAILYERCSQCGYGEAVCSATPEGNRRPRLKTCPRCGCSEEVEDGHMRRWKGYGVYVLQSGPGVVKAGTFPRAIPDHKVSHLVARFNELGQAVRYVTRWNDQENRVEVLLGIDR